jgi:hypothetical protein
MLFVKHDVAFLIVRNFGTNFRAHYTCWTLYSSYVTIGFSDILSRWPFVKQKKKLMQLCDGGNKTVYDFYLIVKVKYNWMERWDVRWVCCAPIIVVRDSVVVSFIYIIFLSSGARTTIPRPFHRYHILDVVRVEWGWYGRPSFPGYHTTVPPKNHRSTCFLLDRTVPDDTVDENHIKIFLLANKNSQTVLVTDLKPSTG